MNPTLIHPSPQEIWISSSKSRCMRQFVGFSLCLRTNIRLGLERVHTQTHTLLIKTRTPPPRLGCVAVAPPTASVPSPEMSVCPGAWQQPERRLPAVSPRPEAEVPGSTVEGARVWRRGVYCFLRGEGVYVTRKAAPAQVCVGISLRVHLSFSRICGFLCDQSLAWAHRGEKGRRVCLVSRQVSVESGWQPWSCPPPALRLPCARPRLQKDAQRRKPWFTASWHTGYRT